MVNRKRVQRIWREEGLRVPKKARKRRRLGESTAEGAERLRATHPNHVWALDFQHDATTDGRELKLLNIVDEFTREALQMRKSDEHRAAIDALLPRVEAAFTGPAFWEPFVRDAHAADIPRLSDWLEGTGRVVSDQFRRRGLRSLRPIDMPLSTSPMDGLIAPIRDALRPRRYGLRNRERTNRLLLMQLHANRQADPLAYAKSIRVWLEANHGRPRGSRRAVADPRGQPSLR